MARDIKDKNVSSGLIIKPEVIARIDAKLIRMTRDGAFTGSVLIAQEGKILLNKGYGMADRLQGIPNTPQTRFHLGSMTKQFTAMAILILQSQGKLTVKDHIYNFVTGCPATWQDITIHQSNGPRSCGGCSGVYLAHHPLSGR